MKIKIHMWHTPIRQAMCGLAKNIELTDNKEKVTCEHCLKELDRINKLKFGPCVDARIKC